MALVPIVVESTPQGERSWDIYSRLLRERIVFLHDEVNYATASVIIAQMLHLEAEDPTKDIKFYINSPGGSIMDGFAIFDTMEHIKCDVMTIGMGMCASMGAFLLCAGTPGKRMALPRCEVMIHQPSSGFKGQLTDMEIQVEHTKHLKEELYKIMAARTGKTIKKIEQDCNRDNWMTAVQAKEYGLVDQVLVRLPSDK